MEVTAANFSAVLPQLLAAIDTADFIAFDTELSGLRPCEALQELTIDSLDARWAKLRYSSSCLAMLQFGVCTFKYDTAAKEWTVQPYSLYTSPISGLQLLGQTASASFVCQASSLEFLGANSFDFNKMASNSIPFTTDAEAAQLEDSSRESIIRTFCKLRDSFHGRVPAKPIVISAPSKAGVATPGKSGSAPAAAVPNKDQLVLVNPGDIAWFEAIREAITQWMASCESANGGASNIAVECPAASAANISFEMDGVFPVLRARSCPGFLRAVLHAHATATSSQRFVCMTDDLSVYKDAWKKDVLCIWVGGGAAATAPMGATCSASAQAGSVSCSSSEFGGGYDAWEKNALRRHRDHAERKRITAMGVLQVIQAMAAARVPIVGHNCLLDIAHMAGKFYGPAPIDISAFATSWLSHFPATFDTKHLLCTSLGELPEGSKLRPWTAKSDLSGAYKAATSLTVAADVLKDTCGDVAGVQQPSNAAGESEGATTAGGKDASPAAAAVALPVPASGNNDDTPITNGDLTSPIFTGVASVAEGEESPVVVPANTHSNLCNTRYPPGFVSTFSITQPIGVPGSSGAPATDATDSSTGFTAAGGAVDAAHDAGADAYMTGVVFAATCALVHRLEGTEEAFDPKRAFAFPISLVATAGAGADDGAGVSEGASKLGAFLARAVNRLNVMKTAQPCQRVLHLQHAATAAHKTTTADVVTPSSGTEAEVEGNSVLACRASINNSSVVWISASRLLKQYTLDEVRIFVLTSLGLKAEATERRQTAHYLDENSCLVVFPTVAHALQATQLGMQSTHPPTATTIVTVSTSSTNDETIGVPLPPVDEVLEVVDVIASAGPGSLLVSQTTSTAPVLAPYSQSALPGAPSDTEAAAQADYRHVREAVEALYGVPARVGGKQPLAWSALSVRTYRQFLEHFKEVFGAFSEAEVRDCPSTTSCNLTATPTTGLKCGAEGDGLLIDTSRAASAPSATVRPRALAALADGSDAAVDPAAKRPRLS